MLNVSCFSDTHGQHRNAQLNRWFENNPGDILIFAGDLQKNISDNGLDFLQWFSELPYKKKVLTFGNHDWNHQQITERANDYKDLYVLNQTSVKLMGVRIFASPYSLPFCNWWFMKPETELEDLYAKIPENTDILVTHTPAFETLDECENGYNLGSMSLRDRVAELKKLKVHVVGHCHEAYGRNKYKNLTSYNGSVLDSKYRLVHSPITFNI